MSIEIQPYLTDLDEEMLELGLPVNTDPKAFLRARQDLLAGTIDAWELNATVRRYQQQLASE